MKLKLLFMVALVFVASMCSSHASLSNWYWNFDVYSDFQDAGTSGRFGVASTSIDGYDTNDIAISPSAKAYIGTYNQKDANGWTGDTGFYRRDFKAPFTLESGQCHSWIFYIWADDTLGSSASKLAFNWTASVTNTPPVGVDVWLKLVAKPSGITGGPAVGTIYNLWDYPDGYINLPVYRTSNGLEGYKFELTATVVPEPSSFFALAGGLAGVGGAFLRRRRG